MTTTLAEIAYEHCTQLKWELAGLGIAQVAVKRLGHDGEGRLLPGNVAPLERIHLQAFSPGTKRRPALPATKHRVNLADLRHTQYSLEQEDRRLFCRLADFHESVGIGPKP